MEMVNGDGKAYGTYHWMDSWPGRRCANFKQHHRSVSGHRWMPWTWANSFHEYAVERSSDHVSFYIDGKEISRHEKMDGITLSRSPFFLVLNTALGGGWADEPDEYTELPAEHVVDYVRVARLKSTEGAGHQESAEFAAAPHSSFLKS